jgi:ELWxxDGT repeat protein
MKRIFILYFLLVFTQFRSQVPQLVKDIEVGSDNSLSSLVATEYNGKLLFAAHTSTYGFELWISDGTNAGTKLVKDINPGSSPSLLNINAFFKYNGRIYFKANDGTHGLELWVTDGTTTGTQMVKDICAGAGDGHMLNSNLYIFNSKLFFVANDGQTGFELWTSDGTNAGTQLVKDVWAGSSSGCLEPFIVYKNMFFFRGWDGVHDVELWRSDGTNAGTNLVKDIDPTNSGVPVLYGSELDSIFYFTGQTTSEGEELWRTDGTLPGTTLVKDIQPGTQSSLTSPNFISLNNKLFFQADNGVNGMEVYTTDGTNGGTQLLDDVFPGVGSGCSPNDQLVYNGFGKIFFLGTNGTQGFELFESDGTTAGTTMVKDIWSGTNDGLMPASFNFLPMAGYGFFTADDGINGKELWRTDGTAAGTLMLKDINPTGSSSITKLTDIDGIIYFSADNGTSGLELWRSDGTTAGTQFMGEIYPGITGSDPKDFVKAGNLIYFMATNDTTGSELFALSALVGLKEIKKEENSLLVFPNPSQNIFYLKCSEEIELRVYDLMGEEILHTKTENKETQIDLGSQQVGIYFLRVGSNVRKLIKK